MGREIRDFIKKHNNKINYCECIIYPDGTIDYAEPSHTAALERFTGEDREIIYKKMPIFSSPIHWLVEYTGCVSVWPQFSIMPTNPTKAQLISINNLIHHGLTKEASYTSLNEAEMKSIEIAKAGFVMDDEEYQKQIEQIDKTFDKFIKVLKNELE